MAAAKSVTRRTRLPPRRTDTRRQSWYPTSSATAWPVAMNPIWASLAPSWLT